MSWIRFTSQCCVDVRVPSGHSLQASLFSPLQVNALLPTDTFIVVMRGLMGNQLASVRRKAMELLNNKLQHRTQWDEQQVVGTRTRR